DLEIFNRRAAAEKLPLSTTRAKAAMPSSGSIGRLSWNQDGVSTSFRLIGRLKPPHFSTGRPNPIKGGSMMDAKPTATAPFVRASGTGSTLNVLGITHIYKATAAETAG